ELHVCGSELNRDGDPYDQAADGKFGARTLAHLLVGVHDATLSTAGLHCKGTRPAILDDRRERRIVWSRRSGQDSVVNLAHGAQRRRTSSTDLHLRPANARAWAI